MAFTKQGSLLAHVGIPAAVHVGQNIITKANMVNPEMQSIFAKNILQNNGATGGPAVLAQRGVIPEVGILNDEMHHLGHSITNVLRKNNIAPGKITPDQEGILRDLFSGKYTRVFNHPKIQEHIPLVEQALHTSLGTNNPKINKEAIGGLLSIIKDPKTTALKRNLILRDLEKIHGDYGVTNKLLSGVGNKLVDNLKHPIQAAQPVTNMIGKKWNNISDAVGTAAMTAIDAPTGIINAGKKIMTNTDLQHKFPLLQTIGNKLTKFTTTNPIKNMYNKGLQGKDLMFRPIRRFVDNVGFNPLISDAKNIAYDTGRLFKRWR